ncbi:hypothetical protein ACPOL_2445 [Acidisarcina polymorpha]|uniref:Organic solvent tolerance-like N-terminal domain-containing protein n=1 Tax=Acidisarcina polymorpha TaxID=2211140 RepID=A0A2Z5FZ49_9BACT|nr:LptA/OstA family protein [Acidisarcina polymorpha]AXC11767.1 hypothetical protein ACPOL_2445 [Acidisarcina polymorpha]
MPIGIARLRRLIVSLAVLLIAVLALFFLYARHKAHQLIRDLPGKLGVDVTRSSDGFTYSQSVKGQTAFTIHASNAVQYTGGSSATLHNVVITLYGAHGDRNDRITGSEFNYDQKAGVVTAKGEVQIDLQGATGANAAANSGTSQQANAPSESSKLDPGTIHVKTSGLIFNQNTQLATTTQYVEFTTAKGAGHSTGATYDVQKGLLVLDSSVELTSNRDGEPIAVHASHLEFLRNSLQAFLLKPISDYQSERTSADQAIVYFRKDGSAEHIDSQGHVHLVTNDGRDLTAGKAKVLLDVHSQPTRADVGGGLNFISHQQGADNTSQQMHGIAVEATLEFASGGTLHHAQARDAVSFVDQQNGLSDDPGGSSTRELRAPQVDIDFLPPSKDDAQSRSIANQVLASGGATAVLHTIRTKGPSQNTTIKGDQLLASLRDGHAITSLHGAGHTSVVDASPNGANSVTSGDTLQVNFATPGSRPASSAKQNPTAAAGLDTAHIQSVIQEGNVVIIQTPAAKPDHPATPTRATALRADYDAATQILRLQGSPRVNDASTDLTGDEIAYHRDSGVADVTGNVKATYAQAKPAANPGAGPAVSTGAVGLGSQGPRHVVSNSATLDQGHGKAIFRGQARLWQGPNSVAAPIIEVQRTPETLKAYGESSTSAAVTTVMTSTAGPQHQSNVFRVHSQNLIYADAEHKAVFTGAVTAEDASGTIHSDQIEAFLATPNPPTNPSVKPEHPSAESGQSRIERIVATGHIVLQQPGRRGLGERLIYTSQDGKFVLTGTSATPPRLYDQIHGNVSGEALIFNSQDDSVSVTGGQARTVTNTRTAK